jgi:hypothetical protein
VCAFPIDVRNPSVRRPNGPRTACHEARAHLVWGTARQARENDVQLACLDDGTPLLLAKDWKAEEISAEMACFEVRQIDRRRQRRNGGDPEGGSPPSRALRVY